MPDEIDRNQVASEGRGRSVSKGDVPEQLRRRYYLEERGGAGLGFYVDARVQSPSFRDLGARMVTPRSDPNAIRDMAAVARHRGWSVVIVNGEANFRREMWLAATALGIEVRGYRPTERDRQDLERRIDKGARQAHPEAAVERRDGVRGKASIQRVVEAVVRDRVADRSAQERILYAARHRIADWLQRGARLKAIDLPAPAPTRDRAPERQRSR